MRIANVTEKEIIGISVRTNNKNEMNPLTGQIGPLVKTFDESVVVNYKTGARVYSLYYDYESDASGDYSVLIGADKIESSELELQTKKIPTGNYLVFAGSGQVPQIVFETWSKIWAYFAADDCPYLRAYTIDFEYYKNQNEIEIHIAVK